MVTVWSLMDTWYLNQSWGWKIIQSTGKFTDAGYCLIADVRIWILHKICTVLFMLNSCNQVVIGQCLYHHVSHHYVYITNYCHQVSWHTGAFIRYPTCGYSAGVYTSGDEGVGDTQGWAVTRGRTAVTCHDWVYWIIACYIGTLA